MPGCRKCGTRIQSGRLCKQCQLDERHGDDVDPENWDPEPADLREGETRDDDNTHADANAKQVEMLTDGEGGDEV